MGNSCCFNKKSNLVVERITIKRRGSDKLSIVSPKNWVARSRRSSIYIVNNEDISKKYKFGEQLGTGYFGIVKTAVPVNDVDKKYACKSIDKSKLPTKKINSLIREIETLSMVDHPNIIKYYETYNDNRYFHIIMEYCTGGDLFEHILKKKNFCEKEACHIIFKLLSAIVHCHSLGIVHRDLKPENILYENKSEFSEIKIIDFGLSRKLFNDDDLHSIVGSPFYVAPEVLDGNYDAKCDVWSIGVITYCLLSGRPPFYSQNKEELFKKIKSVPVAFTHKIWENISESAIDFIQTLLAKNHKKRLNARKALQHKWFENILEEDLNLNQLDPGILTQLKNFHEPRLLTRAVLSFIVKKLNNTEIDQLTKSFNILDKDKTGFLDITQLQKAFEHCKIEIKQEELKSIFNNCSYLRYKGQDNAEKINYSAFIAAAMDRKKIINSNMLWEVFNNFDTDNLGYISIFNFEKAIERTGKKKSFDEIKLMFKELGLPVDAQITFEEFTQIIEKDL
jgi:calcium-dependent protein kinase